jgi:hypothetical protein
VTPAPAAAPHQDNYVPSTGDRAYHIATDTVAAAATTTRVVATDVVDPTLLPNSRTLSLDPYVQVQQQLYHPRVTTQEPRRSAGGGADVPTQISVTSAAAAALSGVPGWWSCESSLLPDGSTVPTSSSSSSSSLCAASSSTAAKLPRRATLHTEAKAKAHSLAQLKDDVFMYRMAQRTAGGAELLPSTSSCGCPTICSCRTDDNEEPHHATRFSKVVSNDSGDFSSSSAASVTGATPADTSRTSDDSAGELYTASSCCSCCHGAHHSSFASSVSPGNSIDTSSRSLCSSCEAAARTHVMRFSAHLDRVRRGEAAESTCVSQRHRTRDTPYVQRDVFVDAVRDDAMWTEVPPLLHLSLPLAAGGRAGKGTAAWVDDATVLAERERAQRRAEYIRQAALLAAGKNTDTEPAETVPRCTAGVQTDTIAGDESEEKRRSSEREARVAQEEEERERQRRHEAKLAEERLRGFAAAQCAEVALPMLQREFASYETRASAQQQQQLEVLQQQLREYQRQAQERPAAWVEELRAYREQWEQQQQRAVELEELRRRARRRDAGTCLHDGDAASAIPKVADGEQPQKATVKAERRAVGTQHSDGALEQLATVQSNAAAWLTDKLCLLEEDTRRAIGTAEEEARHNLLHVLEHPCRQVLLRCQNEVLQLRQRGFYDRQSAVINAEVQSLQLQEALARQELTAHSADCLHDIGKTFQRQLRQIDAAVAQAQLSQMRSELAEKQQQLSTLEAAHKDSLEHTRQLRLQLLHALRMPTVTFADPVAPSRVLPPGAALMDAAYAYATATADGGQEGLRADGSGAATARDGALLREVDDLPVHRRFARAHQEALRVVRAQCRTA